MSLRNSPENERGRVVQQVVREEPDGEGSGEVRRGTMNKVKMGTAKSKREE